LALENLSIKGLFTVSASIAKKKQKCKAFEDNTYTLTPAKTTLTQVNTIKDNTVLAV